jgi:hypothetical protein
MDEFSFRPEGVGVVRAALGVWLALGLGSMWILFLFVVPKESDPLAKALWFVIPLVYLAWLLRGICLVETVKSSSEEFIFRRTVMGIPLESPRRIRKRDVSRVAIDRRMIPGRLKNPPALMWAVILLSTTAPLVTTVLPMSARDADELHAFLQKALGR